MPRYAYRCEECEIYFEIVHSIKEKLIDCEGCNTEGALKRVPYVSRLLKKGDSSGKLVVQHIEETRNELAEEKEKLRKVEHE